MLGSRVIPEKAPELYRKLKCPFCEGDYWAWKVDNEPRCPHCGIRDYIHPTRLIRLDGTFKVTDPCPQCGSQLIHQEGCLLCHACGYSKC